MPPTKSLERQIDDVIETDLDFWLEFKQREAEQLELIDEDVCQ